MAIISGKLIDSNSAPMAGYTIVLISNKNTSQMIKEVVGSVVTSSDGSYSFNTPVGNYQVGFYKDGVETKYAGDISVYSDTPDTNLNVLLTAPGENESTPEVVAIIIDYASQAEISASNASDSESNALAYKDAAAASAQDAQSVADGGATYESVSLGIANTASGQYFRVPQGINNVKSFIYYKNNSGTAVAVSEMAGLAAFDLQNKAIGLVHSQGNLFTTENLDLTSSISLKPGSALTPIASSVLSLPAWKITSTVGATSEQGTYLGYFDVSNFASGFASASIQIVSINPTDGSTAGARLGVFQFDSLGNEISAARVITSISGASGISNPSIFELPAIALNSSCNYVSIYLGILSGSSTIPRELYFRDMLMADGKNASFRRPSIDKSSLSEATTGSNNVKFLTPFSGLAQATDIASYSAFENLYPDSTFSRCVTGDTPPGWPVQLTVSEKNGELCLATPAGITGAGGYDFAKIPVDNIKSRKLSVSCAILEKIGDQGVNASSGLGNMRIRISAYTDAGTLISNAWQNETGNDDPTAGTGWQYYTRNVPREDITKKTVLNIATGINLPSNATTISINIRLEGLSGLAAPRLYANRFSIREGKNSSWVRQQEKGVAYVAPNGNDSTGNGSASSPFATLDKANDAINGFGTIYLKDGEYNNISISNKKVKDVKIIGIEGNYLSRPLIRFGTPLSGITKTSGRTYVYQAPCTGFTPGMLPPWIWLDGVNDADTLVPQDEMHVGLRGRMYRLECTKIWRTTASDKSGALAEMDINTGLPKSHWEASEGIIYFTLPNGGDATASGINIYAPRTLTGIVKDVCDYFSARGSLEITGIDIRYGDVQTSGFRVSHNTDVRVLGAPVNCFDNGNWHKDSKCEASGAGSNGSSTTSDGFNTHAWSVYFHEYIYTHDNVDDGESAHENCHVHGLNPISEYNGGSGLTPAYGCQATYVNPETRKNALGNRLPTGKLGGIEANANPLDGATYARRTFIQVYSGRSYGDKNGYSSQAYTGNDNQPYLIAYDCFARNSVFYGFNCSEAVNCKYLGTGTPYNAARCNIVNGSPLS